MSTSVRVTYDEFEAMIARGEFDPSDPTRYELIEREVVPMPPPSPPHQHAINQMNKWSCRTLPPDEVTVSVQGPIGLPGLDSAPFPDLVWLREGDYSTRRPFPPDILLIIEVSDSSLSYDLHAKARLYASGGVADYWIVNLPGHCFEVLRDPGPDGYRTRTIVYPGESIRPLAFPELAFPTSLAFPEEAAKPGVLLTGPRP